ncbi:membrane bound o-acyl transferase family domain-containing protein [Apiospora hydei]|uniref:Membrane bound o-acyl transferase family domain-containing protein n=1 Tax=Apiospora hydei TaxID=1337664 RepID=A0ABR1WXS4_9PEZI
MVAYSTSGNPAMGYGCGLIAAWSTIHIFTLLVWTRPQWDAKRVERYTRRTTPETNGVLQGNGHAKQASEANGNGVKHLNGHANGHASPTTTETITANDAVASCNGHATNGHVPNGLRERHPADAEKLRQRSLEPVPGSYDGKVGLHQQEYFYKWQEYPEDAPFRTRFNWAFDIATQMRMTGADGKTQEPLDAIPNSTPEGYVRYRTRSEFILQCIVTRLIPCYLVVDLCATLMTQDPYFILGPEHNEPLPANLASLPAAAPRTPAHCYLLPGVLFAIDLAFSAGQLALACFGPLVLGFRAHPWHMPTANGSFVAGVLDRGLEGFWGQWWHQTFRFGFAAPTNWLVREGYLKKGSPLHAFVGAIVAFGLSGFIHAMGSYSTVRYSWPWDPPVFFMLAGAGAQIQRTLARHILRESIQTYAPRWLRRTGNLVFTFAWMHMISSYLLDDFSRCGLWLWEPIPFSFARMLGLGTPGGKWWRWGPG